MKKIVLALTFMIVSAALFAGGTENRINRSAGYVRFPAKNAECSKPDAMFYNPSGTAFLEDGLYIELGNQFLFKEYSNEINGKDYKSDIPTLFYPNFELVWKKNRTALFTGISVHAGGGSLDYENGNGDTLGALDLMLAANPALSAYSSLFEAHSLEVGSAVIALTLGGSYQVIEDTLSLGAGLNIYGASQTRKIALDNALPAALAAGIGAEKTLLDTEATGTGFGGVFSIHYKPVSTVDVAVTYHTESVIEYEYNDVSGSPAVATMMGAVEDDTFDYHLPGYLSFGLGWQATPQLYLAAGSSIYFNQAADYDYDNAFEINFAGEYQINEMFAVSLGGFYTNIGCNSKAGGNSFSSPCLDSFTYCGGTEITIGDFTVDLGAFFVQYFEETWKGAELDKNIFEAAIGVTYKIF